MLYVVYNYIVPKTFPCVFWVSSFSPLQTPPLLPRPPPNQFPSKPKGYYEVVKRVFLSLKCITNTLIF